MSEQRRPPPEAIKKMADLLRAGATMLGESCPTCNTPLFRLKSGEVVCPVHGRVLLISRDEELSRIAISELLERLQQTIANELSREMKLLESASASDHRDEGEERVRYIILLLEALERAERLRRGLEQGGAARKERSG